MNSSIPQPAIDALTTEVFDCLKHSVEGFESHGLTAQQAWLEACSYVAAVGALYATVAAREETPIYREGLEIFDKVADNIKTVAVADRHLLATHLKPLIQEQPLDTKTSATD